MIFVERKCWILTFKVEYTFLQDTLYMLLCIIAFLILLFPGSCKQFPLQEKLSLKFFHHNLQCLKKCSEGVPNIFWCIRKVLWKKIRPVFLLNWGSAEAYLEPSRISTMELFCWKPLTTIAKSSIVDVRLGPKYASALDEWAESVAL